MEWKSFSSLVILALGFVYILYKIKKIKQNPDSPYNKKVTKYGYLMIFIIAVILCSIFSLEYIAPNTFLGKIASSQSGRFFMVLILVIAGEIIEKYLKKKGIFFLANNKKDSV